MLKNSAIKRIITSTIALIIMLVICLFPNNDDLSIPSEVVYVDELTEYIYAVDPNGYVARTTIYKSNKDLIPYIIEALTVNSSSSVYLPSGFTSIIPKDTKLISYNLEDSTLKLNFSKEFLNIKKDNENKLIESLIYSLLEIENVKSIMLFVDGEKLNKMPSGKVLPLVLDKSFGINKIYDIDNIKNTSKTTVYYISKYNGLSYYLPITKVVNNNEKEKIEIVVKELQKVPTYNTSLVTYLNASYELKDYEVLEDSIKISFNNELLANLKDENTIEEVKYVVALSIRDTYNIDNILVNIN